MDLNGDSHGQYPPAVLVPEFNRDRADIALRQPISADLRGGLDRLVFGDLKAVALKTHLVEGEFLPLPQVKVKAGRRSSLPDWFSSNSGQSGSFGKMAIMRIVSAVSASSGSQPQQHARSPE
jgi:hypothetical protein